ncbi:MAG: hypothetical protein ACREPB_00025 [Arenimonas sp.]
MLLSLGLSIAIFLSTALLTWGWIKIALAKDIHDQPERRRLHLTYIPRAGGVSIALVMTATGLVYFLSSPGISSHWTVILAGIVIYGALGFWDDLKPMGAGSKLFFHLLAALAVFFIMTSFFELGYRLAISIALAYLLFVNIWNFMDGSNGMVGVQSLVCAVGFMALSNNQSNTHAFALILAISCLGFLPFNFPVARVFLGDVGSHVLGAALVGLALLAYSEGQCMPLEALCLFSALWIDAVLTFIRRSLRGFKVTHAHRSHLYQYAIRRGQSHASVCLYYAVWTIAIILIVGLSRQLPEDGQRILLWALIALGCAIHQWLRLFCIKIQP